MIETPERVVQFLRALDSRNYLAVKFAVMPAAEWFRVLRAFPSGETLVARVRHLPDDVLDYLSASPSSDVRGIVAFRPELPLAAQLRLAADAEAEVRRRLASGRGVLRSTLRLLAHDSDGEVARRARARLDRGDGRLDDRLHRSRSRKYWGAERHPRSLARAQDPATWQEELRRQAELFRGRPGLVGTHVPDV